MKVYVIDNYCDYPEDRSVDFVRAASRQDAEAWMAKRYHQADMHPAIVAEVHDAIWLEPDRVIDVPPLGDHAIATLNAIEAKLDHLIAHLKADKDDDKGEDEGHDASTP